MWGHLYNCRRYYHVTSNSNHCSFSPTGLNVTLQGHSEFIMSSILSKNFDFWHNMQQSLYITTRAIIKFNQEYWKWQLHEIQVWIHCSSQPSMVHWLSSSIFPCSFVRPSVRPAMVTADQISTFFSIYRHKSLVPTQFYLLPSSTKS